MSDKKEEQQAKPERKIKDEDFKPSTTTKTVMRNDGTTSPEIRIDTFERKK